MQLQSLAERQLKRRSSLRRFCLNVMLPITHMHITGEALDSCNKNGIAAK